MADQHEAETPPQPLDREEVIAIARQTATAVVTAALEKNASKRAKTIGDVLDAIAASWNTPLDTALPKGQRRIFAFCGALPWGVYNLTPAEWRSYIQGLDPFVAAGVVVGGIAFHVVLACWFAWLIAYRKRKCSPTRLFLEGFLLPGLAAALLSGVTTLGNLTRGGL